MATQLFHTSSTDVTWLFIGSSTWTAVEVNIGIVSGNFPPLPLLGNHPSALTICPLLSHESPSATVSLPDKLPACLPSLRPILVAILGDSAFASNQQSNSSEKKPHTGYSSSSGPGVRTKAHRKSYMGVEGDTWNLSDSREPDRDILVRHDISVMEGELRKLSPSQVR